MKVIVCLDDNNGMMFNNRRQSRDKLLIDDIIAMVSCSRLYINKYSEPLFQGLTDNIISCDNPLEQAGDNDYCFVENLDISPYTSKADSYIFYRWNRKYPADMIFDIDISEYKLISTSEFPGSSHEKITKEVYTK